MKCTGEMRQFLKRGAFMYSRCVYVCWYVTCIDVASQICRIMKRSSRELSIGPIGSLLLAPRCRTGWHIHKKGFFLFLSLCQHAHHVRKSMGFSRLQRPVIHFLFFLSTPQQRSSRATMKTSHLINIHPTPVTQPWTLICSFPFSISLSQYHVSISYYIPQILFGISLLAVNVKEEEKKEKRRAWFVWIQAKNIFPLREKNKWTQNPKQIKSTDVIYYPPATICLCNSPANGNGNLNMMERRHSDWKEVLLDFRFLCSSIVFSS